MIEASCHCGAVRLRIASAPTELNECLCSICSRYGVRWAYYATGDVEISVPETGTDTYLWGKRSTVFHRCPTCGCVSHWSAVDPARDRVGVNARLMPRHVRKTATVRYDEGPD